MTSPISVPQEILDAVFEAVDVDPSALAAYCTISLSFCRAAQRQLFRKIRLNPRYHPIPIHNLMSLISANPRLATYVHVLEFVIPACELLNLQSVCTLLAELSCVREVVLFGGPWSALQSSLQAELLRIIRSSRSLSLEDVHLPRRVLRSLSKTRQLRLLSSYSILDSLESESTDESSTSVDETTYLRDLELFSYRQAREIFETTTGDLSPSSLSLSQLQSCNLTLTMESAPYVQSLLNSCSEHLRDLHVQFCMTEQNEKPLDLNKFSHVQQLHLDSFDEKIRPLQWIRHVIETIPAKNELTRLELSYSSFSKEGEVDDWTALDSLLSQPRFDRVEHVDLKLRRHTSEWHELQSLLMTSMPCLTAKGGLFLSVMSPIPPTDCLGWKSARVGSVDVACMRKDDLVIPSVSRSAQNQAPTPWVKAPLLTNLPFVGRFFHSL